MDISLKACEDFLQSNTRRKKLILLESIAGDFYLGPAERGVIFLHYTKKTIVHTTQRIFRMKEDGLTFSYVHDN